MLHVHNHQIPPIKFLKLQSITITAIASNYIEFSEEKKQYDMFFILNIYLLAVGNGDGSDLYFTIGNYDELLEKFYLNQATRIDGNICKVSDVFPYFCMMIFKLFL